LVSDIPAGDGNIEKLFYGDSWQQKVLKDMKNGRTVNAAQLYLTTLNLNVILVQEIFNPNSFNRPLQWPITVQSSMPKEEKVSKHHLFSNEQRNILKIRHLALSLFRSFHNFLGWVIL
jgi:hypothetical protein